MQKLLKKRKRLSVVRLQFDRIPNSDILVYLRKKLSVSEDRIFHDEIPLDFSFGFTLPQALPDFGESLFYNTARPSLSVDCLLYTSRCV